MADYSTFLCPVPFPRYDYWNGVYLVQLLLGWHKFIKLKFLEQCLALTNCSFIIAVGILIIITTTCLLTVIWIVKKHKNQAIWHHQSCQFNKICLDNFKRSVSTCAMSSTVTHLSYIGGTHHLNIYIYIRYRYRYRYINEFIPPRVRLPTCNTYSVCVCVCTCMLTW